MLMNTEQSEIFRHLRTESQTLRTVLVNLYKLLIQVPDGETHNWKQCHSPKHINHECLCMYSYSRNVQYYPCLESCEISMHQFLVLFFPPMTVTGFQHDLRLKGTQTALAALAIVSCWSKDRSMSWAKTKDYWLHLAGHKNAV